MVKIKVKDVEKNEEKIVETPFTVRQWTLINFAGWGFYKIVFDGKKYMIFNKFENNKLCYEVRK